MIGRAYRFAQLLSIDIVIGVVILLRFFCVQYEVDPGWEVYVLLGGSIWLIYTADHLRDAENAVNSTRERYQFHHRNRKWLRLAFVIVFFIIAPLILFIPVVIVIGGFVLALLSFIYLLVQHKLSRFFSKELYVAVVYTLGVLMVPTLLSQSISFEYFVMLFLLTFINLGIFSWFEVSEDETDHFKSIATEMKSDRLEKLLFTLLSVGLAISFLNFTLSHIYFLTGFVIYGWMLLFPSLFHRNQMYRAVGDGVFLVPIIFEWL